jgi:predicted deacylase
VEFPVARYVTGDWLRLGVEVVHGSRPGPAIFLSGAIHGDELDGVEIIRAILSELNPAKLRGTVYAAPVVNVFGFVAESRYLPDRRDLNRSFPGDEEGSMASRLAHLFMTEVVDRCEIGLDFHCGSDDRENMPQIRANLDDARLRQMAMAFAAPLAIHNTPPAGSLRKAAEERGAPTLVYEGGEAGRFTESAIEMGVAGSLRVMRELGMIRRAPEAPAPSLESRSTHWVRAPRSGICRIRSGLGDEVKRGKKLGAVFEILGEKEVSVKAGATGMVIGRRVNPLVYQGEAVVHIARLK